jgi:hypothetical protein
LSIWLSRSGKLSEVASPAKAPSAARDMSADEAGATRPAAQPASAAATLSLGELSGPEMEALFDLLPRDPDRSSVSF